MPVAVLEFDRATFAYVLLVFPIAFAVMLGGTGALLGAVARRIRTRICRKLPIQ